MTRILGIAPYEGLKNMMLSLAQPREDIFLTAYEANYLDGLRLAQAEDLSAYDIIVTRGGTADLLREMLSIPVVSVELSYYDILNAIKLAQFRPDAGGHSAIRHSGADHPQRG